MRITCPSCQAVYEAPDAEIGVGRSVECSACGARWWQPGETAAEGGSGESRMPGLEETAAELRAFRDEAAAPPAPAADGDATAAEEPEQAPEAQAAAAERPSPAGGLRAAEPVAPEAPRGGLHGIQSEAEPRRSGERRVEEIPIPPPPPLAPGGTPPRRRPASIDAQRLTAELRAAEEEPERRRGGGFAAGFVAALLISAALAFAYLERERLADIAPQAAPALEAWGDVVDEARASVERAGGQARDAAAPLIDGAL
jgi:predicted Zn finger-like uncharacterized protein